LLAVAFVTLSERKVLAALQRRVGPNSVGVYGSLQAFRDALKLVTKETLLPFHTYPILLVLSPAFALRCSIIGFMVVPFSEGAAVWNRDLGILARLAVSSFTVYAVLYAGWRSSNRFAFIGAVRSAAQII
jgi:NADH-ubiquinone oxidoreductase chain 1